MKTSGLQEMIATVRGARYSEAAHTHPLCAAGVQGLWAKGWGDPQLDDSLMLLWIEDASGEPIGVLAYHWERIHPPYRLR